MPRSSTSSSGITPEPSSRFDVGQWAMTEPGVAEDRPLVVAHVDAVGEDAPRGRAARRGGRRRCSSRRRGTASSRRAPSRPVCSFRCVCVRRPNRSASAARAPPQRRVDGDGEAVGDDEPLAEPLRQPLDVRLERSARPSAGPAGSSGSSAPARRATSPAARRSATSRRARATASCTPPRRRRRGRACRRGSRVDDALGAPPRRAPRLGGKHVALQPVEQPSRPARRRATPSTNRPRIGCCGTCVWMSSSGGSMTPSLARTGGASSPSWHRSPDHEPAYSEHAARRRIASTPSAW